MTVARVEAEYNFLLTHRVILQPLIEANLSLALSRNAKHV